MTAEFRLIMLSALYENGGNMAHRCFDGHPELYVYPFESQLGNRLFADHLSSLFPFKYRWPRFPASLGGPDLYDLFYDEELKVRLRTPDVSKFRDVDLELDEARRKTLFAQALSDSPGRPADIIAAFFVSTFEAWRNRRRSGAEHAYLGYSPIVCVDADRILSDFPTAQIVHVVRNPYSAYADTKRRPFPLSLRTYAETWCIVQQLAVGFAARFPEHVHIVRYEDVITDPEAELSRVCRKVGLAPHEALRTPSWNGVTLTRVHPWGTIVAPTPDANAEALRSLSADERAEIGALCAVMLREFDYTAL